jgi:methyl halide transferase
MIPLEETNLGSGMDWDAQYREGTPHWETGVVPAELVRVMDEGLVPKGMALELGCGTGAAAIFLMQRGFEVTAVDHSPTAIERARVRAEKEDTLPRFVLTDMFEFGATAGQFDFVYDSGFYHFIRQKDLDKYLDLLWRVTKPGSYYMTLAGAPRQPGESIENGPPQVTKRQIFLELGRLFEIVQLLPCRLESPFRKDGYAGWSCLMRRTAVGT